MELIPDWKRVLKKAWSVRFLALAGVLTGCEFLLPLYVDAIPRGVFAFLIMVVSIAGIVARVVSQAAFKEELEASKKDEHEPD